jgi:hypothetical protein
LQFEESSKGPIGQPAGSGASDLFEGEEVDVQPWATVAEGAARDNFAPLGGEVTDIVELLGGQSGGGHVKSLLGFAPSDDEALTLPFYGQAL